MRRRLFGVGTPRTLRAHWALCELGLDYESVEILPRTEGMQHPELLRLSRRGKIPIFQDGDLVLGESGAIVSYLADRHRDRARLAPEPGSDARAHYDELCSFVLTELDAALYVIRRHEGLPGIYGASEVACSAARDYYRRQSGEIERRLADGRPYLLGDDFSGADLLWLTCHSWACLVGIEPSQRLAAHGAKLGERPACRAAHARNWPPAVRAALRDASAAASR